VTVITFGFCLTLFTLKKPIKAVKHVKIATINNAIKRALNTKWKIALLEPVPINVTSALLESSKKSYPFIAIATVTVFVT
jgi:hypothetical protein